MFFVVGTLEQRDRDTDLIYIPGQKTRTMGDHRLILNQRNINTHVEVLRENKTSNF